MKSVIEIKKEIEQIRQKVRNLNFEINDKIKLLRENCSHEYFYIVETEFECSGKWVKTYHRPERICRNCGLVEEDSVKHMGSSKLWKYDDIPKMKQEDAQEFKRI